MYRVNIDILNERGEELLSKQKKIVSLDNILDINLSELYAEAQQNELFDGYDDTDETEVYRESLEH